MVGQSDEPTLLVESMASLSERYVPVFEGAMDSCSSRLVSKGLPAHSVFFTQTAGGAHIRKLLYEYLTVRPHNISYKLNLVIYPDDQLYRSEEDFFPQDDKSIE